MANRAKFNLSDVVTAVASDLSYTKKAVDEILQASINLICDRIAAGERVNIHGLGVIYTAQRAARNARNPKTGELIKVPAKLVRRIHFSKSLKG